MSSAIARMTFGGFGAADAREATQARVKATTSAALLAGGDDIGFHLGRSLRTLPKRTGRRRPRRSTRSPATARRPVSRIISRGRAGRLFFDAPLTGASAGG